jgi:ATP-binding cassette subfamily G (WHITE) protein 2
LSYKLHNSVKIIDMRRHLGTAALAGLSLAWTTYGYSNYSSIDMMRTQLSLMDDRPDDCPPWYDAIPPKRENVLIEDSFNCLLPAFTCGQYSECNQYNGKCSCPAGYGGDDCLAPGMDVPIPHLIEQC